MRLLLLEKEAELAELKPYTQLLEARLVDKDALLARTDALMQDRLVDKDARLEDKDALLARTEAVMQARLAAAQKDWELKNQELASSNTELLRYKRACVYADVMRMYMWMDGWMDGWIDRPTPLSLPSTAPSSPRPIPRSYINVLEQILS